MRIRFAQRSENSPAVLQPITCASGKRRLRSRAISAPSCVCAAKNAMTAGSNASSYASSSAAATEVSQL
jgi:hypothetical protein